MLRPYIGITGFTHQRQVESVLDHFARLGFDSNHRLMVGVLVSHMSLTGQPMKPEWQFKYPAPEAVNDIFVDEPQTLNLIHYNSKEPDLADQLERLMDLAPLAEGVQLNIAWPDPNEVARFKQLHPGKLVVLQVSTAALMKLGRGLSGADPNRAIGDFDPGRLSDLRLAALAIANYFEWVDYFLPDLSGGVGKNMDPLFMAAMVAGQMQLANAPLPVVGGGLMAENLPSLLDPLLRLCPWLSWDAEGRLFDGDGLDLERCRLYLEASKTLIDQLRTEPKRHPTWIW